MITIENVEDARSKHKELISDDSLYIELDNGEIREVTNITFIDGKLVLRPSVKL